MKNLPFAVGEKIHDYTIQSEWSRGSMGIIYTAHNSNGETVLIQAPWINRVAIKNQFIQNATKIISLRHDSLLSILDSDLTNTVPWYAMSMPPKQTLRDILQIDLTISPLQATRWGVQLADVLGYLHRQKEPLFHGNLVPENIFIQQDKLWIANVGMSDFGSVSKYISSDSLDLLYCAPEQLQYNVQDYVKVEIYALGIMLYEMLAGHTPFGSIEEALDKEKKKAFIEKVLDPQVKIPPITDLPSKMFAKILQKCLHKDISMRYADMEEVNKDLKKALRDVLIQQAKDAEDRGNDLEAYQLLKEAAQHGFVSEDLERLENKIHQNNLQFSATSAIPTEKFSKDQFIELLNKIKSSNPEDQKNWQEFLELDHTMQSWENCLDLFVQCVNEIQHCMQEQFPEWKKSEQVEFEEIKKEDVAQELEDLIEPSKNTLQWESNPNDWETLETPMQEEPQLVQEEDSVASLSEHDEDSKSESNFDMYNMATIIVDAVDYPVEEDNEEDEDSDDEIYVSENNISSSKDDIRDHIDSSLFEWIDTNTIRSKKDGSEMIYIPQGVFVMGSESIQSFDVEKPEHEVYLDSFFMDKYPITWEQYYCFCKETRYPKPIAPKWEIEPNHPVVNISWYDAKKYCEWAGKSLPTEAQWEKAARGGIWLDGDGLKQHKNPRPKRKYPWGEEAPNADGVWHCNYNAEPTFGKNQGKKQTSPVGYFEKGASPYGIQDLAGNVWEWTRDWFSSKYYRQSPDRNPTGPGEPEVVIVADSATGETTEDSSGKVLRGGSWYIGTRYIRVTTRRKRNPEACGASCGMRTILEFTHDM